MFFRIFELIIVLGLLYLVFRFLIIDTKLINKKVNDEIKKGEINDVS